MHQTELLISYRKCSNKFREKQMKFQYNNVLERDRSHRVNLNKLMQRLHESKKKERNSNIAISIAAVSAVTVFGIILSL